MTTSPKNAIGTQVALLVMGAARGKRAPDLPLNEGALPLSYRRHRTSKVCVEHPSVLHRVPTVRCGLLLLAFAGMMGIEPTPF